MCIAVHGFVLLMKKKLDSYLAGIFIDWRIISISGDKGMKLFPKGHSTQILWRTQDTICTHSDSNPDLVVEFAKRKYKSSKKLCERLGGTLAIETIDDDIIWNTYPKVGNNLCSFLSRFSSPSADIGYWYPIISGYRQNSNRFDLGNDFCFVYYHQLLSMMFAGLVGSMTESHGNSAHKDL